MEDIIICSSCKGTGKLKSWGLGHNPDLIVETCSLCNGTGRLIVHEYRSRVPFGTNFRETDFYEVDKKIHELIRKYEIKVYEKDK